MIERNKLLEQQKNLEAQRLEGLTKAVDGYLLENYKDGVELMIRFEDWNIEAKDAGWVSEQYRKGGWAVQQVDGAMILS